MRILSGPVILDTILECLHRYEDLVNIDLTYCEMIALGLKVIRYFLAGHVNISDGNGMDDEWVDEEFHDFNSKRDNHFVGNDSEIGTYLIAFCHCISNMDFSLDVIKTRLLTDLCVVVLSRDVFGTPSSTGRVKLVLESSLVSSIVMNASNTSTTRQRLLCALCMTAEKL